MMLRLAALIVLTLLMVACTPEPPAPPEPVASVPAATSGAPEVGGPQTADAGSLPDVDRDLEAAEKYAGCLQEHGIDAIAVDGMILYPADDGETSHADQAPHPGAQGSPGPIEQECQQLVPEYRAADLNQR